MSHYKLKGTSGSVINQSFPFADTIVLGSSPDCDVQLDDPGVAARQTEVRLEESALVLRNLGSDRGGVNPAVDRKRGNRNFSYRL